MPVRCVLLGVRGGAAGASGTAAFPLFSERPGSAWLPTFLPTDAMLLPTVCRSCCQFVEEEESDKKAVAARRAEGGRTPSPEIPDVEQAIARDRERLEAALQVDRERMQVRTKALPFCCASTVFLSQTVPARAVPLPGSTGRDQAGRGRAAGGGRGGGRAGPADEGTVSTKALSFCRASTVFLSKAVSLRAVPQGAATGRQEGGGPEAAAADGEGAEEAGGGGAGGGAGGPPGEAPDAGAARAARG
eukprot:SAG22_NODE_962_length_6280_cov_4.343472_9_plen_246_part_00